jgi:hypothetical protein
MKRTRTISSWLLAWLLVGLISASFTRPSFAETLPQARPERGLGPHYDAAHESTLTGTIQEAVTKHEVGTPPGMHLLVAGPQGIVDAHLGPFMNKETKAALVAGMPVQIVGANVTIRNKQYLLARELTVGGHTITIRNEHGMLAVVQNTGTRRTRVVKTKTEVAGGER